jgi:hypothetical protein
MTDEIWRSWGSLDGTIHTLLKANQELAKKVRRQQSDDEANPAPVDPIPWPKNRDRYAWDTYDDIVKPIARQFNCTAFFQQHTSYFVVAPLESAPGPSDGHRPFGHIYVLASSLKANCSRHGAACRVFVNPGGAWEELLKDCVEWLALADTHSLEDHKLHATCLAAKYT